MARHPTHDWLFEDGSKPAIRAASKAMLSGRARKVGHIYEVSAQPYCDNPVPVRIAAPPGSGGVEVQMFAPCRKCKKCLQFRSLMWRERALAEIIGAHNAGRRTWLLTLTFSPQHLAGLLAESRSRGDGSLKALDKVAYGHVRAFLDRVRKAGSPFRYLAVFERGEESGRAHYHLLLHESTKGPILKRTLETRWRSHIHARLVRVDEARQAGGAAGYVSKYATKTAEIRIRASAHYGSRPGQ